MAILIDFSNPISSNINMIWKNRKEPEFRASMQKFYSKEELKNGSAVMKDTIRAALLRSLGKYIKKFPEHGKLYFCLDRKDKKGNYWRNYPEIGGFKEYKLNRKLPKKILDPVPPTLYKMAKEIVEEFKVTLPFTFIDVNMAEGDDSIAVLTKHFASKGEEVLIISEDKDMVQLQKLGNVTQYRPIREGMINMTPTEASEQIIELIMSGDKSDGVPNIRSEHGIFLDIDENGKQRTRQKSISTKLKERAKELLDIEAACLELLPEDEHEFINPRIVENTRWINLIDDTVPQNLKEEILRQMALPPVGSNDKLSVYFSSNPQCQEFVSKIELFAQAEQLNPFEQRKRDIENGSVEPEPYEEDDFWDNL